MSFRSTNMTHTPWVCERNNPTETYHNPNQIKVQQKKVNQ